MSDRVEVLIELVWDRLYLYIKADRDYKDAILRDNAGEAIDKEAGIKDGKHLRIQNTLLDFESCYKSLSHMHDIPYDLSNPASIY